MPVAMPRRTLYHRLRHVLREHAALEWKLLLALAVVVGGAWLFLELGDDVAEGETQSLDQRILLGLREADAPGEPIGPEWLDPVMRDVTALGGVAVLVLVLLTVVGYLAIERKFRAMWLVLIATVTGQIMSSVLKLLYARDRPDADLVPHLAEVSTASFPSGHSTMSAVVYLTLGALLMRLELRVATKIYTLSIALALTLLVGASRVYLGVHYPTDVLAGWLVGATWALLVWSVARWLQNRAKVERPYESTAELERRDERTSPATA